MSDLAALKAGLIADASFATRTGVVASLSIIGEAAAISLEGSLFARAQQTAYIASGSFGLAIVDVSNPRALKILSQLPLDGSASDISVDAALELAAVADGAGGLRIVDVADPTQPRLLATVPIAATTVVAFEGVAYANNGATLDAIDLSTGLLIQKLTPSSSAITGLARDGSTLYVMDAARRLTVVDLGSGQMIKRGSVALSYGGGRIFAGDGVVYVAAGSGFGGGYATVDVRDPTAPKLIEGVDAANIAGGAIALNGSGLGVLVGTPGGASALDVVNTLDAGKTDQFVTRYTLPAAPQDIAIGQGVAFVADGSAGLQVVNYLSYDTKGVAPTITITQGPTDIDPATAGLQVVEGSTVSLKARIGDDVQVRNVEVLVNGQVASDSVSYPWDLEATLPTLAANGSTTATIQIEAIDTGGNTTISDPITLTLTPDKTSPTLLNQNLAAGSVHAQNYRAFRLIFSKPLLASTVTASAFSLVGPGGVTLTPTSVETGTFGRGVTVIFPPMTPGAWSFIVDASALTDRLGNALGAAPLTTAFTVEAFTTEWLGGSGPWANGDRWTAGLAPTEQDIVELALASGETVAFGGASGAGDSVFASNIGHAASVKMTGAGVLSLNAGVLDVTGDFTLAGGTLKLNSGATLKHANLRVQGGTVGFLGGALDGVSYKGALDLSAYGSNLQVENGLTVAAADGASPGTITLGQYGTLYFDGSQTLDNANVLLTGSGGGIYQSATYDDFVANGYRYIDQTLTLGPDLLIDETGGNAILGLSGYTTGTIVNKGAIKSEGRSGTLNLYSTAFVNQGLLAISNGGVLNIAGASFTNAASGRITLDAGSTLSAGQYYSSTSSFSNAGVLKADKATLNFYNLANFTNTGTIDATNSTVNLYGPLTRTILATYADKDDALGLFGAFDNTGLTLKTGKDATYRALKLGGNGVIKGGTVVDPGSAISFEGGTLEGVTFQGALDLTASSSSLHIDDGLSATGAGGVGAGLVTLGDYASLLFDNTQTFDHATIRMAGYYNSLALNTTSAVYQATGGAEQTLTFGASLKIDITGTIANFGASGYGNGKIVNKGVITAAADTGRILIASSDFVNEGKIAIGANSTLDFTGATVSLAAKGSLTVGAGATLTLGSYVGAKMVFANRGKLTADKATVNIYDLADFSKTGVYAVTNSAVNLYASTLTLADLAPYANVDDAIGLFGAYDNTGATLKIGAKGTYAKLTLGSNGVIKNGVVADAGSAVAFSGGVLDGVTYRGALDLSAYNSSLHVANGLTATGADGTGSGLIDFGDYATLYLDDTQTLDNATLKLTGSSGSIVQNLTYAAYVANGYQPPQGTLTFGANLVIDQSAGYAGIGHAGYNYYNNSSTVVNKGRIKEGGSSIGFTISGVSFVNEGTIDITAGYASLTSGTLDNAAGGVINVTGATLTLGQSETDTLSNEGAINATNSTVSLYLNDKWKNTGTLSFTNSTIKLFGTLSSRTGGLFSGGGNTVELYGRLNNTGLVVGPGTFLPAMALKSGGSIVGGTVSDAGSGLSFQGGVLDGVTYRGTLDLSAKSSRLEISHGLTAKSSDGTGAGAIKLGDAANVQFDSSQTFDNATVSLAGTNESISQYTTIDDYISNGFRYPDSVLTFGSHLLIDQTAGSATMSTTGYSNTAAIDNKGVIKAEANGGSLNINPARFVNDGGIFVSNGDTLQIGSTFFGFSDTTAFANNGLLSVASAKAVVQGNVTGGDGSAAKIVIATGGRVDLNGTVNTGAYEFDNAAGANGILAIKHAVKSSATTGFLGRVANFFGQAGSGDSLVLQDVVFNAATRWSYTQDGAALSPGGVLTVADNQGHSAALQLLGRYLAAGTSASSASSSLFTLAADTTTFSAGVTLTSHAPG